MSNAKAARQLENKVASFFRSGCRILMGDGREYEVLRAGKPRPVGGGECKTDFYLLLRDDCTRVQCEYKISCKISSSNAFQENKILAPRAESIFGSGWENIIRESAEEIRDRFEKSVLISSDDYGNPINYKLGWRLDILTNDSRKLSVPLKLSEDKIRDYIYKGTNQSVGKINSRIGNVEVPGSGVASHMLVAETADIESASDVLERLIPIDDYPIHTHRLGFAAVNYFPFTGRFESRGLAVRVDWKVGQSGNLYGELIFDSPLSDENNSRKVKNVLLDAIKNSN